MSVTIQLFLNPPPALSKRKKERFVTAVRREFFTHCTALALAPEFHNVDHGPYKLELKFRSDQPDGSGVRIDGATALDGSSLERLTTWATGVYSARIANCPGASVSEAQPSV